jgi:hypothetical protein
MSIVEKFVDRFFGKTTIENGSSCMIKELQTLRIPESSLISIWVTFTSKANKKYTAVHVAQHPSGPYILLCGEDKDIPDFRKVEYTLTKIANGKPEFNITDRDTDICDVIKLSKIPTPSRVANFASHYEQLFQEVNVEHVYLVTGSK